MGQTLSQDLMELLFAPAEAGGGARPAEPRSTAGVFAHPSIVSSWRPDRGPSFAPTARAIAVAVPDHGASEIAPARTPCYTVRTMSDRPLSRIRQLVALCMLAAAVVTIGLAISGALTGARSPVPQLASQK